MTLRARETNLEDFVAINVPLCLAILNKLIQDRHLTACAGRGLERGVMQGTIWQGFIFKIGGTRVSLVQHLGTEKKKRNRNKNEGQT